MDHVFSHLSIDPNTSYVDESNIAYYHEKENTCLDRGELNLAETYFRKALAAASTLYKKEPAKLWPLLHDLSNCLRRADNHLDAFITLSRVLVDAYADLGSDDRLVLKMRITLALIHEGLGDLDEARALLESILHTISDPRDLFDLNSLYYDVRIYLAGVLHAQGDNQAAMEIFFKIDCELCKDGLSRELVFELFSQHGLDPNARRDTGHSLLHLACILDHCPLVLSCLNKVFNPRSKVLDGWEPIHYCRSRWTLDLLCSHGADLEADRKKDPALVEYASYWGSLELVKFHLQNCRILLHLSDVIQCLQYTFQVEIFRELIKCLHEIPGFKDYGELYDELLSE